MKKIIVIGATGMLGQPIAQALINANFEVKIMARNVEKAKKMFPQANIMQGDLSSLDDLRKALEGQEAVYLSLSVEQDAKSSDWHSEAEGVDNVIRVCKELNVSRIVFLSSLVMNYQGMNGFDWWVLRIKHEAVQKIKASGVAYTIFYPSTFMETYQQQIAGPTLAMLGVSKFPMWFVSAKDYGKQVVKSFEIAQPNTSYDYAIQGIQAFDYQEANAIFIKNYKKKIWLMTMPRSIGKLLGKFSQKFEYLSNIMEALNNYPEKFESEKTWQELGKPEITLATFATEYQN
jgi:uncharacterized protein YbjT (DUF2867 family)